MAPIVLFVYCRPDHTRRTVESLLRNSQAAESDLIIYSDGPGRQELHQRVHAVRSYCRGIDGFRSVRLVESSENIGLSRSIIRGVSETLNIHEQVVILEDDLVVSPHFLGYMNDALSLYRDDTAVASIHGYCYPVTGRLPETFFLRGADCWGWATWKRAWQLFQSDGSVSLQQLQDRQLSQAFDLDGAYGFTQMLRDQIAGRNDSWAVRWHASCFLAERLTLYPGVSLVANIGVDGSGTHCGLDTSGPATLASRPVRVVRQQLCENIAARARIAAHLAGTLRQQSRSRKLMARFVDWWRR